MDARLKARPNRWELLGLAAAFGVLGIFLWLYEPGYIYPSDLALYLGGRSEPGFFYGYWLLPVLDALRLLPFQWAYFIWGALSILSVFFAARVFGGKPALVLLSYQLFSTLFYGQISGILAGGLGLLWWGLAHRRWGAAGLGFIIALTKYQVGLPFGLLMIWYAGISWKEFAKLCFVPALVGLASLALYPGWVFEVLNKMQGFPYVHLGITLWYFIGAWSLFFWVPPLLLPMDKPQRFLALFTAATFAMPYFLHIDLLTLFALPIGWMPLLGQVGWLFPLFEKDVIRLIVLVPLIIYLWVVISAGATLVKRLITHK